MPSEVVGVGVGDGVGAGVEDDLPPQELRPKEKARMAREVIG